MTLSMKNREAVWKAAFRDASYQRQFFATEIAQQGIPSCSVAV